MVTTKEEEKCKYQWYLDLGCLSHMTSRKDELFNIIQPMKNKMEFVNDSILAAEDIGDVLIMGKYGKQSLISNILYIPNIKSNRLCFGQLIEKN